MKKTLFGLSLVLLLAGCGGDTAETEEQMKSSNKPYNQPSVWTDEETGCDYLIGDTGSYKGGVSITPRMLNDGTQLCN